MSEENLCPSCKRPASIEPEEVSMEVSGLLLHFPRGKRHERCVREMMRRMYSEQGIHLIRMTSEGIRVNWENFRGTPGQVLLLLASGIITNEMKGSTGTAVKIPHGEVIIYRKKPLVFSRPEDVAAYHKAFPPA